MLKRSLTGKTIFNGALLAVTAYCCLGIALAAQISPFTPQTKIRVTIVQWKPTKGTYERWDPIGGEFLISDERTISLPVVGTLSVADLDAVSLAARIADELKRKTGLVETPQATIDILERPPVYVVGEVEKPGEYQFRDGMSVLQALAMGGGFYRSEDSTHLPGTLNYTTQLKEIASSVLRSKVKIVRLEAEASGANDMIFDPNSESDPVLAREVFEQEKVLHAARMSEVARQAKSYGELRDLFTLEVENIGKKVSSTDQDIDSLQKQIGNIKGLVDKGIVVPARQSELERLLRSYFSERLDLETSITRARQNIAEATRNLDGLHDRLAIEVAASLQAEKAAMEQLEIKRDLTQALLLNELSGDKTGRDATEPNFTVIRRNNQIVNEIVATSATLLQPGDVVRISRSQQQPTMKSPVAKTDPGEKPTERSQLQRTNKGELL